MVALVMGRIGRIGKMITALPHSANTVLAEALPWLHHYRDKIVVVKYGGNAMVDERLTAAFAADMVFLRAENAYTEQETAHLKELTENIFQEVKSRVKETDMSVPSRRGQHLRPPELGS